jgi:hypothetical protein
MEAADVRAPTYVRLFMQVTSPLELAIFETEEEFLRHLEGMTKVCHLYHF